jgi:3' terminal RNA ribose 2'-O-methyltransferase Hen1
LAEITTTRAPATDLGFLLHKPPDRHQSFDLSFGTAHVFYPEASAERCSACLLLDVDPVRLVRGKGDWKGGMLDKYVNDRPYVASSFISVAISQVFGSALAGRSKEKADLVDVPIPLQARIDVLPVRGGEDLVHRIFEPLGSCQLGQRMQTSEHHRKWPYLSRRSRPIEHQQKVNKGVSPCGFFKSSDLPSFKGLVPRTNRHLRATF